MSEFFNYVTVFDHKTTVLEIGIPMLFIAIIIILIFTFRNKLSLGSKADKIVRFILFILLLTFYVSNYILLWTQSSIKISNLPLQLCPISALLCILLLINKNKRIFNFVIFTGVLGGIGSVLSPDVSCSFIYYRYYQFMGMHMLIAIVPIYYAIVYKYLPNKKEAIETFVAVHILAVFMGIFNTIFKTDYMYVSFTKNIGPRGTILAALGEGYMYFITFEVFVAVLFIIWFYVVKFIFRKYIL
ncbi:TMEM164-related integral membrane acyltransferase [Faecalimicrobium sp. JNUCC 81]